MKRYTTMTPKLFLVAGGLIALVACKQAGQTSGKVDSVDNFARSDLNLIRINACQWKDATAPDLVAKVIDERTTPKPAADSDVRRAMNGALSGVPRNVLQMFLDLNGHIELSESTPTACKGSLTDAEKRFAGEAASTTPMACWDDDSQDKFIIHLGAGTLAKNELNLPRSIGHNLVRMLGLFVSQIGPRFLKYVDDTYSKQASSLSSDQKKVFDQKVTALRANLETYKAQRDKLSDDFLAELTEKGSAAVSRLQDFKAAAGKDSFGGYLVAESFDSYYCHADVRAEFQKNMPKTATAFEPIRKDLESVPAN